MKDLEVVSRPMLSWRVQQTFVPMEVPSMSFVALSRRGSLALPQDDNSFFGSVVLRKPEPSGSESGPPERELRSCDAAGPLASNPIQI